MAKMGRPKTETKGVMVRVSEDMLQSIDDVRRNEADVPTRPEMIRRILAEWLEQKSKAEDSGLS
jgi:metal-responsive CopG/Arc/MetJ family transcriptional regulator